jgi:Putative addiction module component
MSIQLPLDQMSLADKLEAIEILWADTSKTPSELPLPAWHKSVLEDRRRLVADGSLNFLDWDMAIEDLRKELRANPPS